MEALFAQPGWKILVDDFAGYKESLQNGIFGYDSEKSFFIAKGRAQAYDQLLSHEGFLESLKQQILDTEEPDA
jgi:hypothetical protein